METIITELLQHEDPCIRYKIRVGVLGESPDAPAIQALRQEICASPRVRQLLSERLPDGRLPHHPYQKWRGAHWLLATLADIGYPPGDQSLIPLREQVYAWLLSPEHLKRTPVIRGLARRCTSQEGNAVYATLTLGLADERTGELARRLAHWQWPDGGWNCDKRPEAHHSSFWESLIPLRALGLHARLTGDSASQAAAGRAAEFFLKHRLYQREGNGQVMQPQFIQLHYPCYWRYDILFALKVMGEIGRLADPRCQPALDLLLSLRLPEGGFPAGGRFYRVTETLTSGSSRVDWGPVSKRRRNDFVSAEALTVLNAAGRYG